MPPKSSAKILVVDDIQVIRSAILESLSQEFYAFKAKNAKEAIAICENEKIDLVITDIKMPGMSGIELIRQLREKSPNMKFAAMTAYNIDDFIGLAREEEIWNIVPKSVFLDINHVRILARKLLSKDPFGIYYYYPQAKVKKLQFVDIMKMQKALPESQLLTGHYYTYSIDDFEAYQNVESKICQLLSTFEQEEYNLYIELVLQELCTNAIKYTNKYKSFDLCFGILGGNTIIGVVDYDGRLERNQILLYFERQATLDTNSGRPIGLEDSHGRGFYIIREKCDHLIFNINPGKKTEIIAMIASNTGQCNRAVSIFQTSSNN